MISVRQTRALPLAFFRFHLTMDTLAFGYTLPTTRACYGLSPIRLRPYWAHTQKGEESLKSSSPTLLLSPASLNPTSLRKFPHQYIAFLQKLLYGKKS
ncbi:hypothetical protein E5329_25875, partial [Petralouisia muris]